MFARLKPGDQTRISEIDLPVKNKWNFRWLEAQVDLEIKAASGKESKKISVAVGDSMEKINRPGEAFCNLCSDVIKYGSRGKAALLDHLRVAKHVEKVRTQLSNHSLGSFGVKQPNFFPIFGTSGGAQSVDANETAHKKVEPVVPLPDRVSHQEALVLAVAAEQGLAFSTVPVILNLAKALAKDPEALNEMSMDRTSASYKMKFGLAKTFTERTIEMLRQHPFSLNIDEATSASSARVLTVLVNYVDPTQQRLVTEHLTSISLVRVDSQSIYSALVTLFEDNHIPWKNLISILMDSCNVMRGSKAGLETLIRENKAQHLLDIDGDVCHHIHNATKKFCEPFLLWVEGLFSDIHNEFHWSKVNQDVLQEVSMILGVKYTMPQTYAPYRWLSVYDCAQSTLLQLRALTVYFFGFLTPEDRKIYQAIYSTICQDVSQEGKNRLQELARKSLVRSRTAPGKKRLVRLLDKLFVHRKWTKMVLGSYVGCLGVLKEYVMLFQSQKCLVHELHTQQLKLFQQFLSLFLEQEAFHGLTPEELVNPKMLNIRQKDNIMSPKEWFLGVVTEKELKVANSTLQHKFRNAVKSAFLNCAEYLQAKLPINNKTLQAMAVFNPVTDHSTTEVKLTLKRLPELVSNVFLRHGPGEDNTDDEEEFSAPEEIEPEQEVAVIQTYQKQVLSFCSDNPPPKAENSVDEWWASLPNEYHLLKKMVLALLTCFHGPKVESAFSNMSNILDARSSRMAVSTLSAIQTVRYSLKASGQSAVDAFSRKDKLCSRVNHALCRNMKSSRKHHKAEQEEERQRLEQQQVELSLKKQKCISKQEAKVKLAEAEKAARMAHRTALRAGRMSKLQALSAARKQKERANLTMETVDSRNCNKLKKKQPLPSKQSASTSKSAAWKQKERANLTMETVDSRNCKLKKNQPLPPKPSASTSKSAVQKLKEQANSASTSSCLPAVGKGTDGTQNKAQSLWRIPLKRKQTAEMDDPSCKKKQKSFQAAPTVDECVASAENMIAAGSAVRSSSQPKKAFDFRKYFTKK